MDSAHFVRDFSFEISFPSEAECFAEHNSLGSFVSGRLTRVADEVFSRLSPGDRVVKIDSLDIDLGYLPATSYYEEAEKRFRDRLEEALRLKLLALSGSATRTGGNSEGIVPWTESELDIVMGFLDTGYLPWNINYSPSRTIEKTLRHVIANAGPGLARRLRLADRPATAARRLAWQFPVNLLTAIARLLEPVAEESLAREQVDLDSALQAASGRSDAVRLRYWEFTLLHLLKHSGTAFDQTDWFAAFLEAVAREQPLDDSPPQFRTISAGTGPRTSGRDTLDWRQLLEQALVSGDAGALSTFWSPLLEQRPELVAQVVRQFGSRADVRRAMARGFPDSMLCGLALLLEAEEVEFIKELVAAADIFREAATKQRESGPGMKALLWEYTLTYLLVERGHRFNRRAYVKSVVRQLALGDNLRYEDFVLSLIEAQDRIEKSGVPRREIQWLHSDLHAKLPEEPASPSATGAPDGIETPGLPRREIPSLHSDLYPNRPEEIAPFSVRKRELLEQTDKTGYRSDSQEPGIGALLRSYELYDILTACLLRGARAQGGLSDVIGELREQYPWQLLRILQELRASTRDGSLPAWLSTEELSNLADAFLHVSGGKTDVLKDQADRVANKPGYRLILSILIQDRFIPDQLPDFSAPDLTIDSGGIEEDPGRVAPTPALSPAAELTDQAVESALMCVENLTATEIDRLIRALDRLMAQPEEWLIRVLHTVLDNPDQVRIMIGMLPERQLARLLLLTAAAGSHRVLWIADTVVDGCKAGEIIPTSSNALRLKWLFLFQYLIQLRLPVSEVTFLSQFIPYLAEQSGYRDTTSFSTLVVRQLSLETFSTRAAARRRIIEILDTPKTAVSSDRHAARDRSPAEVATVKRRDPEPDFQHIYIRNAGQVLASPYFPRLFERLGLLEDGVFRKGDAAQKAIHLLQYMVDETMHPPEHLLPLNKVLCGLEPDTPVLRHIDLLREEKDAVEGLLRAMIAHWKAIGNTSVQGLRESFLQREGHLRLKSGDWQLLVQPRAFDMLLDRLPWGFKVIRHPWMNSTVYVEWR
jgi:hypothetical protein